MAHTFRNSYEKTFKVLDNSEAKMHHELNGSTSKPIHVQRVERAVQLNNFLKEVDYQLDENSNSDDSIDISNNFDNLLRESESHSTKDYYNLKHVSQRRAWLAEVLQENADSTPDDAQYKHITKLHTWQKQIRSTKDVDFKRYIYYGSGLLSEIDRYPEIEKSLPVKSVKKRHIKEETSKSPLYPPEILEDISDEPCIGLSLDNVIDFQNLDEDSNVNSDFGQPVSQTSHQTNTSHSSSKKRVKKFKDEESRKKWEDMMKVKRKKIFTNMAKKEIGKQHRSKINKHKEMLIQCRRVAQQCLKYGRQKALQSARTVKEQQWRMKRLSRENIAYWKRSRRFDREVKKRLEKEAEEQRKIDHELIEAKRQQRKLNFLITQTELYAHFMSRKLGKASPEEQLRILSQLDEEQSSRLLNIDDYDSEVMKEKAKRNAQEAFQNEKVRTRHFDIEAKSSVDVNAIDGEQPQPSIFQGKLKGYQLRGMNWLANLYAQGISGILADEMGLGKTVQSIAFLCHIAERYSVWGPFLIISPASTLHNWQQEIAKFVPNFKVVPYWGNPNERKILRQFWDQKDIYTKDASFHIVITSYQIVITDIKYFNRIKWQYMILDEAQAIKSTSSMRWKTLLGFSCRNRLLLSGTPIQNSMAELWALLHFIMPTLFDSHEEFNEWFSKDIESHAENKTGIDEKHLSRLHMILKPFMLRRIKKDVENELSDKIEVMVYCPLTTRQQLLYMALKQKIKIEDLLHYSVGGGDSHTVDKNFTSNLMNLVMQFRKVCNHPELFERRDAKSPIHIAPCVFRIPYLIYDFNVTAVLMLTLQKYFVFTPGYIAEAVKNDFNTLFRVHSFLNLSFYELYMILQGDVRTRWTHFFRSENEDEILYHRYFWNEGSTKPSMRISYKFKLTNANIRTSSILPELIFTRKNSGSRVFYTHTDQYYYPMPETVEHRNIRCKNALNNEEDAIIDVVADESPLTEEVKSEGGEAGTYRDETPRIQKHALTDLPSFLFCTMPKVTTIFPNLYCYSRRVAWLIRRHNYEFSYNSLNHYWSEATGHRNRKPAETLYPQPTNAIDVLRPLKGWSYIAIPDKETLVTDSGKLSVLDGLLKRLKEEGHRVLIYSQMTKMIDLLEEYMWHRHHKYMRLDGSSKISERRDMVADFQARTDIFVFLLSTRAGGLGINLTAADTVIFYDSDWNPTVDQQAMDRAHRLGQTKQVTVYRLICKGSIEERILQRAREKSEIQKLVISGGNFKPDTLKPKEVVSLLLDDAELIHRSEKLRVDFNKTKDEDKELEKKRKHMLAFKTIPAVPELKKTKSDSSQETYIEDWSSTLDSGPSSPHSANSPDVLTDDMAESGYGEEDSPITNKYTVYNVYGSTVKPRIPGRGGSRRGRPRGSRRMSSLGRTNSSISSTSTNGENEYSTNSQSTLASPTSNNYLNVPLGASGSQSPNLAIRRGPGRPRLKPTGPPNTGSRGTYRPRKPARPLPVPLPSDGSNVSCSTSGASATPSYSTYLYDLPDQDS
ncbi:chromatin-remodeling ATPase INO80 [Tribolium castaneum]|uniref:Chromatin-remodeling ATPase INO80 n=1 Tax=Tribolium castaneum TaxID=7070 RepID=D6W6S5_TRICA|nr:PREDICTED: putative DNA helicase Ino80 [Tribolium castaneum]EFA10951.2 Putative DNA helicase Ino80-like Protein [Tribolium castaneum]|eukprot:XP_008200064.1 PREDICTED: putative DNA helicase Ino80 [Tribolium castaneum]